MWDPPDGYDDCLHDARETTNVSTKYHAIDVPDVGEVLALAPKPNACAALAMAANSKVDDVTKVDYLVLFALNHLAPGEEARLLVGMMGGEFPANTYQRVARSISTWGTARPTRRSSR